MCVWFVFDITKYWWYSITSSYGDDHGAAPGGVWYSSTSSIGLGGDKINKILVSPDGDCRMLEEADVSFTYLTNTIISYHDDTQISENLVSWPSSASKSEQKFNQECILYVTTFYCTFCFHP